MARVSIQLPALEATDKVDVSVTVNGEERQYTYRLELFEWEAHVQPEEARVDCLKRILSSYDRSWKLVEIGVPTDREVSILFQQRKAPRTAS